MDTWPRKKHFEHFYKMDYPHFNISMNIEISNFLKFVKENHISFYYSMCFACTAVLNQIENFRYRIHDGKVIIYDRVHPSFTDIDKNSDLFKIVTLNMTDDIVEFSSNAKYKSLKQKGLFENDNDEREDLIYYTCTPWFSFTQLTHPIELKKEDSIPRVSWGKYYSDNGKVLLPFSVQANHALVDGCHVGMFVDKLNKYMNSL
jgi:chloramphenicol O-acetyltransferase type A